MVMFSVMPVMSAGTYDAWVDVNHDGHVNVLDLIKVANSLGSSGDPALNVTVANPSINTKPNWPNATDTCVWYQQSISTLGVTAGGSYADGFTYLHVLATVTDSLGTDTLTLVVVGTLWNKARNGYYPITAYQTTISESNTQICFTIPVPSQYFYFLAVTSANTHTLSLSYYLTWG